MRPPHFFILLGSLLLLTAPFAKAFDATYLENAYNEYQVKAKFLLRFTYFIKWPANAFHKDDSPLLLCVLGGNPFHNTLRKIIQHEWVKGHPVDLKYLQNVQSSSKCHLLFITAQAMHKLPEVRRTLHNKPVLTVGESTDFAERNGGMIGFFWENGAIRFVINRNNAAKAGLSIHYKLLKLARVIE